MVEEVVIAVLSEDDKLLLDNISRQISLLTVEISRLADAVEASVDPGDDED